MLYILQILRFTWDGSSIWSGGVQRHYCGFDENPQSLICPLPDLWPGVGGRNLTPSKTFPGRIFAYIIDRGYQTLFSCTVEEKIKMVAI